MNLPALVDLVNENAELISELIAEELPLVDTKLRTIVNERKRVPSCN